MLDPHGPRKHGDKPCDGTKDRPVVPGAVLTKNLRYESFS